MISVEHLTKKYGDFVAVDDISFTIEEGHVYGFLGPNGAGKSTTMNIMTGCLSATEGSVVIDGYDIFTDPYKAKRQIGYLPEQPPLYMNETPREYLRFVAEAKGLKRKEIEKQVLEVMKQTKIEKMANKKIGSLSKGYKQRVGIAQALLGNPKVIILDEPTVGLDPFQIIEIRDLICQLGKERTVILSSHILSEVQMICDRIIMIANGTLIANDKPENLINGVGVNEITFVTEATEEEVEHILDEVTGIAESKYEPRDQNSIKGYLKLDTDEVDAVSRNLFTAFAKHNKILLEISVKKADLENLFIELAGEEKLPEHPFEDETNESEEIEYDSNI